MKSYCVALVSCVAVLVVACSSGQPDEEKTDSASEAIVTGAGSPAPGIVCTQNDDVDPSCNTPPPFWGNFANAQCAGQGKNLAGIGFEGGCPNGAVVHVHYICCGPQ
jgi:hypothetical protein